MTARHTSAATTDGQVRQVRPSTPAPRSPQGAGTGPSAVAGADGHVGGAVMERLLATPGRRVRVVARRPERVAAWREQAGVDARCADLTDAAALTEALRGCDAAFLLVPFDPTVLDGVGHTQALIASLARAVADSGVGHVVLLSSLGADRPGDHGPIADLHEAEEALRATGVQLTAVRATHFQESVSDALPAAAETGVHTVLVGSRNRQRSLVATRDIGDVVADALLSSSAAGEVVDVLGPGYTADQEAQVMTQALGRPVRAWAPAREEWERVLTDAGLPLSAAAGLAAMHGADEDGVLAPRGDRVVHGRTALADTVAAAMERTGSETTAQAGKAAEAPESAEAMASSERADLLASEGH